MLDRTADGQIILRRHNAIRLAFGSAIQKLKPEIHFRQHPQPAETWNADLGTRFRLGANIGVECGLRIRGRRGESAGSFGGGCSSLLLVT